MSETQAPYNTSYTIGPRSRINIASVSTPTGDELDRLLAQMRVGLLMVIRAIEKYQEIKLTSTDKP